MVGSTLVNGHSATEYAVPVPAMSETLSAAGTRPVHISVKPLTLYVWLNHQGRIVCTQATQIETTDSRTVRTTTMVNLSNFGDSVHIVAPTLLTPG